MRVLAYKPGPPTQTIRMERLITCEPLELEYIYTVLKNHNVTLLDGMCDKRDPVRLARKIKAEVVFITAFIVNIPQVLRMARRLKNLHRPPLVFVGGPHAEVVPEHFFDEHVDGVFFADQLNAASQTLDLLERGEDYRKTPGAAFQNSSGFVRNPSPPVDPSSMVIPKRVLLEKNPDRYFYMYFKRCASVKTAFGCTNSCRFCFCTRMNNGVYGARPIRDVVEEIAGIEVENIFILDDNFLSSKKRVLEFCRMVEERGLKKNYIIYGTSDFISKHPDIMAELKKIGLAAVLVGFEFIKDESLAGVNKKARVGDNDRAVEICGDLGIELFTLFMIDPDWKDDDFRDLARYVRNRGLTFATYGTYTVLPGTESAENESGPLSPFWRYDLLRLHSAPLHMSQWRYYLWLLYLYMMPALHRPSRKRMQERFGRFGALRLSVESLGIGLQFMMKLAVWK